MSIRFLRCDATHLSSEDLQDIVNARNTMKGAAVAISDEVGQCPSKIGRTGTVQGYCPSPRSYCPN